MSNSILQSIKPQYCELIAAGKKTIEVRKTKPKLDVPFMVYIYCTKGENLWKKGNSVFLDKRYNRLLQTFDHMLNGKVIGEYVCDRIEAFSPSTAPYETDSTITRTSCLSIVELIKYSNMDKPLYGWHISDLKIYDKPKELSEFQRACNHENCGKCKRPITEKLSCTAGLNRPPQSWCYVEEV